MIHPTSEIGVQIWAQLPPKNKARLSERLFFLVLKQAGGICHEPLQGETNPSESFSGDLCR